MTPNTRSARQRHGWAVLCITLTGEDEYVCDGMGDKPSRFLSRRDAQAQADFLKMGVSDEFQSINVVPYPKVQP